MIERQFALYQRRAWNPVPARDAEFLVRWMLWYVNSRRFA